MKEYIVELDNDMFRIIEAIDEREAYKIAWEIQEELNSEFCEVNEFYSDYF